MNEKLSEKLYNAKIEWSKADRTANYLEEMKKPVLASEVIKSRKEGEKTISMCEYIAYNSTNYKDHIKAMVDAKEDSNKCYARVQNIIQEIEEEKQKNIANHVSAKYSNGAGG